MKTQVSTSSQVLDSTGLINEYERADESYRQP